jgi:hypothetical protein
MPHAGAAVARNTKSVITRRIRDIFPVWLPKPAKLPLEVDKRGEFHLITNLLLYNLFQFHLLHLPKNLFKELKASIDLVQGFFLCYINKTSNNIPDLTDQLYPVFVNFLVCFWDVIEFFLDKMLKVF